MIHEIFNERNLQIEKNQIERILEKEKSDLIVLAAKYILKVEIFPDFDRSIYYNDLFFAAIKVY
jgi:hypothetical protein